MKTIATPVLSVLSTATITGNVLKLTCGQLDRKMYQDVNKVLDLMGGKWDRKQQGHVFSEPPTDKLEQVLLTGEIDKPQDFGYFPTPSALASKAVALAGIKPGMTALEPSAGCGKIATALAMVMDKKDIFCYEIQADLASVLYNIGFTNTTCCDFLETAAHPSFDRVVMNPPFAVPGQPQADIGHVLRAYRFLKPGGKLVAIMSAGVAFRQNKKAVDFRQFVADHGGSITANPEGSFKASGTMVSTVIVVIDKP